MGQGLTQGKPMSGGDIARVIEEAPQAFIGMLRGRELGRQPVQIAEVDRTHRAWRGAACAVA